MKKNHLQAGRVSGDCFRTYFRVPCKYYENSQYLHNTYNHSWFNFHHDVILDEEIPVQALAAKVKCFSEARIVKIWFCVVKTFLFEVFQSRHNYPPVFRI